METQKNEAFALAAEHNNLGPIRQWLTVWAGEVEIERRPGLTARRRNAEHAVHTLGRDAPAWRPPIPLPIEALRRTLHVHIPPNPPGGSGC
jgi:hypothetical protein